MDGFFFTKDGKNHKKMHISLITKTFINFQTAENAMKREKRYFITYLPKHKGYTIQLLVPQSIMHLFRLRHLSLGLLSRVILSRRLLC